GLDEGRFWAEAAYAESMVRSALGDVEGSLEALEQALGNWPTYAPALLSMGSVHYQRKDFERGRLMFLSLLDLPDDTEDLCEIIDKAGDFLIGVRAYQDGLDLYHQAAARFPDVAVFHQGVGCCAGNLGDHEQAIVSSRAALALEPDRPTLLNDLGWSFLQAGEPAQALPLLERAVALDGTDKLSAENLRLCRESLRTESKEQQ
ncbi:tetratricopeptide repeat protein, partial [Planctomycetota bacterium]